MFHDDRKATLTSIQLCGEKEVLAQVKLSFKGTSGAKLVVTRSLQLTVKKATRSQKTLEGQLLMVKDGERTTISSRVAELDQIMPQYLGVSEAILDSVIFCHQDESLWPMSDPSTLKKKFDAIFEALKYTKAIANIKDLGKAQKIELGKHKIFEDQFKIDKDRGERAEKKMMALQDEIESLREQGERLNSDIQEARDSANGKHKQSLSYLNIINELESKRNRAEERVENVNDLRTNLEELEGSDEWLESTLAQYEERMARYTEEEEDYQTHYREAQEEVSQCRQRLSSKLAEQGQYQAEKENYERQIQARVILLKEAARHHAIRGFEGDLDESQIKHLVEKIGKIAREKSNELEQVQKATEEEVRQAQAVVSDLESKRSARTQDKVSAKQTIAGNDKKINTIQNELDSINVDEGTTVVLDSAHRDFKDRLQKAHADFESARWDQSVNAENADLRGLENEADRLNDELMQTTRLVNDRAQLTYLKKELKDRQQSLDTLILTYTDKINQVIGTRWDPSTIEKEYQVTLEAKSRAVVESQDRRDSMSRDLEQVGFKLYSARDILKTKTGEMKACQRSVLNSIIIEGEPLKSPDTYLPELAQLEADRDTVRSDVENYTHLNEFWTRCLTVADKQDKCHVCDHKFEKTEKSAAMKKLSQRIATDTRDQLAKELQRIEDELKEAQNSRPQYETYKRIADSEIPALQKEIKKADEQHSALLKNVEELDAIVTQELSRKRETEALSKTIANIAQYHNQISHNETELARLSSQQKLSGGSASSLEEIQEQLTTCQGQMKALKAKISKMTSDRDRARSILNHLELELRDAAGKLSNANYELDKKQGLLSRIQEMKETSVALQETIHRVDVELQSLSLQIAKAMAQRSDVQQHGRAMEKEIHEDTTKLFDTVNRIQLADNAINAYTDEGGPSKLSTCQTAIKTLEQEMARIEHEMSQITIGANKLKEQVANSSKTKQSISDNLKFRKNLKALEVLNTEIEELESRNATDDYERLASDAKKLELLFQKLLAERGTVLGTMKSKDEELQNIIREWETDYKNAARDYREAHIKVETTKAAIEDLNRYGNALDQAIMKYHSMKMEEINRIAGELWQSTYQGTDVDTILIRSDAENAAGKRNYNYRVCMVKQDAEMDMRGRCSAGQRVLASIIIRLALAECFGVNCGLIALDEPTTNLDRDNIRALAESLHTIIKTRQAQSNFQLIVITHDEEFLKFMKVADFCDNYYRVSRDDKQKSVIERQSIADVL
ncbi:MAG: DNA repair protein rad50 [Claussenomyces sp. TS43310]|nr:MAG: DNA repair protein rad50 [Claussenomyces sp. TS43310]